MPAENPPAPVPYRLILEDGTERTVLVTDVSDDFVGPCFSARPEGWLDMAMATTARGVVVKIAASMRSSGKDHSIGLPVVEILAPWEPSRREVAEGPDKLRARAVAAINDLSLAHAEPILIATARRASDPSVDTFDTLLWCIGVLSLELRRVRGLAQRAAEREGVPPLLVLANAKATVPCDACGGRGIVLYGRETEDGCDVCGASGQVDAVAEVARLRERVKHHEMQATHHAILDAGARDGFAAACRGDAKHCGWCRALATRASATECPYCDECFDRHTRNGLIDPARFADTPLAPAIRAALKANPRNKTADTETPADAR